MSFEKKSTIQKTVFNTVTNNEKPKKVVKVIKVTEVVESTYLDGTKSINEKLSQYFLEDGSRVTPIDEHKFIVDATSEELITSL